MITRKDLPAKAQQELPTWDEILYGLEWLGWLIGVLGSAFNRVLDFLILILSF